MGAVQCGAKMPSEGFKFVLTQLNSFANTFWSLGSCQDPALASSPTPLSLSSSVDSSNAFQSGLLCLLPSTGKLMARGARTLGQLPL